MSGRKLSTVTLPQEELRDLQNRLRRADTNRSRAETELAAIQQRGEERAREQQRAHTRALEENSKRVKRLSRGLREVEERSARALTAQAAKFDQRLREQRSEFNTSLGRVEDEQLRQRSEYLGLIQKQSEQFESELKNVRNDLRCEMDNLRERFASAAEEAQAAVDAAVGLVEQIRTCHRHEKFAPGRLARIDDRLRVARADLAGGRSESALSSARERYFEAQDLLHEVMIAEHSWDAFSQFARVQSERATAAAEDTSRAEFEFTTTTGVERISGADYWTNGRLRQLRTEVSQNRQVAESPDASLEDLKQAAHRAQEQEREAIELSEYARRAVLQSYIRGMTAEDVACGLEDAGFKETASSWADDDERQDAQASFIDAAGNRILLLVGGGDQGKASINLSFYDRDGVGKSDRTLQTVQEVLKGKNRAMASPTCDPSVGHQPSGDVERLRGVSKGR